MTQKTRYSRRLVLPKLALAASLALLFAACGKTVDEPAASETAGPQAKPAVKTGLTNTKYTAAEFDAIAKRVFAPIYPFLARQVKRDFGISAGRAVDAGCGPGYWAMALAQETDLQVTAMDLDPEALAIVRRNAAAAGLEGRVEAVLGDVQKMPFPDGYADLVVSRGSYPFWKDKVQAFREIRRILKPGGVAFIGGGLGSLLPVEERNRIKAVMEAEKIGPPKELEVSFEDMSRILREAGIPVFKIAHDEGCLCGLWVEFRKPADPAATGSPAGR
jgi:SAM-dependent methyltransferase